MLTQLLKGGALFVAPIDSPNASPLFPPGPKLVHCSARFSIYWFYKSIFYEFLIYGFPNSVFRCYNFELSIFQLFEFGWSGFRFVVLIMSRSLIPNSGCYIFQLPNMLFLNVRNYDAQFSRSRMFGVRMFACPFPEIQVSVFGLPNFQFPNLTLRKIDMFRCQVSEHRITFVEFTFFTYFCKLHVQLTVFELPF